MSNNKIIWSEGMFLQPHHFQQQDRHVKHVINNKIQSIASSPWGLTTFQLDQELLKQGKIAILSAAGSLPDGTWFNIPNDTAPPKPLEITAKHKGQMVYLALPLHQPGVPDIGNDDSNERWRYITKTYEAIDQVLGTSNSTSVVVGDLALRLLTEDKDLNGYTYLPIARIESITNNQITLDSAHIPTCLDVHASPVLINFIVELNGLLSQRGEALAKRTGDLKRGATGAISEFLQLQLINRYQPVIEQVASGSPMHPQHMYYYLIQLMGELATFRYDKKRPRKLDTYNHNNLEVTYKPLIAEIRQALSSVSEQAAKLLELEKRPYGIWVSPITNRDLLKKAQYILVVRADLTEDIIRNRFPAKVKVGPVEHINSLVSRSLPGIELTPLQVVPPQIPFSSGSVYFSLNKDHDYWSTLDKAAGIALHVSGDFPGINIEFWAVNLDS